jgi:hypothetical protein
MPQLQETLGSALEDTYAVAAVEAADGLAAAGAIGACLVGIAPTAVNLLFKAAAG